MKKGNKLYSIFGMKCPRCHTGDLFEFPWYRIDKLLKTKERCEHCDLKYEQEPGFFYGAMYISYGLQVAWIVTVVVAWYLLANWGLVQAFTAKTLIPVVILSAIPIMPFVFRLSRSLWVNFFVKFRKEYV